MALLQGSLGLAALVAGLGVSSGLIQFGARFQHADDAASLRSLYRAAWLIVAGSGLVVTVVMLAFRNFVRQVMLGPQSPGSAVYIICVALFLTLAAGVQMGLLNALHNVGAMVLCSGISAASGSLVACAIVFISGVSGIEYAFLALSLMSALVSSTFVRFLFRGGRADCTWGQAFGRVTALLKFGVPFTASTLFGSGVQLVMPIVVLRCLGSYNVGFYRAATAIGFTYLGFLLVSLAQDFYPRIIATKEETGKLTDLVNQELRMVLLLGTPLVMTTLSASRCAVPLLYTIRFLPAVEILRWQLMGDVFRLSAWTMSFVILARCGSGVFLTTEIVGGLTTFIASWLSIRYFGVAGAGIGYLAGYIVYFSVVAAFIGHKLGVYMTRANVILLISSVGLTLFLRLLPVTGLQSIVLPVGLSVSATAAILSALALARDANLGEALRRLSI